MLFRPTIMYCISSDLKYKLNNTFQKTNRSYPSRNSEFVSTAHAEHLTILSATLATTCFVISLLMDQGKGHLVQMDVGPRCSLGTGPAAWGAVEIPSGSATSLCLQCCP